MLENGVLFILLIFIEKKNTKKIGYIEYARENETNHE